MKEGQVVNYDGFIGEIETEDKKYLFIRDNIIGDINVNDTVFFRGENINGYDVAFFVQSKNEDLSLYMESMRNER